MKTTTTTTAGSAYDSKKIMNRAWEIYRATLAEETEGLKPAFGICLKMAWSEAHVQASPVILSQLQQEWYGMDAEEQNRWLTHMVRRAAKNVIGYSEKDRYLQYDEVPAFYSFRDEDLIEYVSETWIHVAEALNLEHVAEMNIRRAARLQGPVTLKKIVYDAADASLLKIYRDDIKHCCMGLSEIEDSDGEYHSTVEEFCSGSDDLESEVLNRVTLDNFRATADARDNLILTGLLAGQTERQIGSDLGISGPAVHKRIGKMRNSLGDAFSA